MRRLLLTIAAAAAIILTACTELQLGTLALAAERDDHRVYLLSSSQISAQLQPQPLDKDQNKDVSGCEADAEVHQTLHAHSNNSPQQSELVEPASCLTAMEA